MKVTNNEKKFFFGCPVQPKRIEVKVSSIVIMFVYEQSLYKSIKYTQTTGISVSCNIITGKENYYVVNINHHGNKLVIDLN